MKSMLSLLFLASTLLAQTDGPATLPRTTPSTVAVSPNAPIAVPAGTNLQAAVSSAVCGDTLNFDGLTTYQGSLAFPMLPCDANHWITLNFNGAKVILPTATSRVYGCAFVSVNNLEVTRFPGTGLVYNLIAPGVGAHDCIFNNVYAHGNSTDETQRAYELSYTRNIAILNPRIEDIFCLAVVGSCSDSQGIAGGRSTTDEGNFLIQGGSIEAAGENILFGGGPALTVPHDITIKGTYLYKRDSWNPSDPSFAPVNGHGPIVKNLLELKNAAYVLVDGVKGHGSWGGYSQGGFAFLLTPKNQNNACPICAVHDVTVRNSTFEKTGGMFVVGFGPSDAGGWSSGSYNYSIHDDAFTDQNGAYCNFCTHWLIEIASGAFNGLVLHDLSIDHVNWSLESNWHPKNSATDGKYHGFFLLNAPPVGTQQMYNIKFTNSVGPVGNGPIQSTGGGTGNCVNFYQNNYTALFQNCWVGTSAFTGNVFLTNGYTGNPNWPSGNYELPAGVNVNVLPQ